ncbi:MAG: SLBB domain-containing protein [Syntrophorhabdaceae bacterium]|nr:SLBB domain-containing protein [Syntrophorhabdaceae bacterium]
MIKRGFFFLTMFTLISFFSTVFAQLPPTGLPVPGTITQPYTSPQSQAGQPIIQPAPTQPGVAQQPIQIPQQLTPQQAEAIKSLTPEQRRTIQQEIGKTGGTLTPEAIEAIKTRPEFKGITPEDVQKGKELLERKEKDAIRVEPEKKAIEKIGIERKPLEEIAVSKITEEEEKKDREKTGLFDRFRTITPYQQIPLNIRPFGYEFFQEAAIKVITDRKDLPVPSKYVIGPGDEVRIMLWGRVNAQYNLIVDRNGNITIPQIGPIQVAGMTFEDMSKHLIKQSEQIVGANIDITMGSLKTIPIFILGDVRRPGAYTIGSFATITDALLMAGGPSGIGSMRNIQLKRGDKVVTTLDLYDLLLKGDKSKDVILQAGDVVFVPVAGPVVGIAGNVKRPAIYELKDRHDLQTVIELAGGVIPTAYTQQIQVERIVKNERQIIIDIDDKNLSKAKEFALQDADLIKIFNIVDRDVNIVLLNGNVKRPGKYEFKPGMTIKDLIKDTTDLLPETYMDYALIRRLALPDMRVEFIPFNLGMAIGKEGVANIPLNPQDNIYIFSKWFFKDRPYVTVEGEVRKGGRFDLLQNTTVKDILLLAGGLTRDAYTREGEIFRTDKVTKEIKHIKFDIEKALMEEKTHNILLEDLDRIVIHSIWGYTYKKVVSVDGDVLNPGTYPYFENMGVRDLIFSAGNILDSAYLDEADVSFHNVEDGKIAKIEHVKIDLGKALKGDPEHNLKLKPYSRVFIKRIPDWRREQFVNVGGEVRFPGKYIIRKGERLSSVIERAGGYTEKAYLRGAVFTRTKVKDLQQRALEETILRLEKEVAAESAAKISAALSQEEIAGLNAQQQGTRAFIESLRRATPTGRMAIHLSHLRLLKGSEYDIELEDGDSLFIPTKNNVVNVTGAVMSQGSYIYSGELTYRDYIERAGGFSRFADPANIFVLKVDGTAMRVPGGFINWNPSRSRWELTAFGEEIKTIEPGDTIVVPEKIYTVAWLRTIRDVTQILSQVGIFAASMNFIFK